MSKIAKTALAGAALGLFLALLSGCAAKVPLSYWTVGSTPSDGMIFSCSEPSPNDCADLLSYGAPVRLHI